MYRAPKGTFDILPYGEGEPWQKTSLWHWLEQEARTLASSYGYGEIRTPVYESKELFDRGVGDTSDIVTKEMFVFQDKGHRALALRPEGTSSVIRAFLQAHLAQLQAPHKLFYIEPMFRYERPQSGRYRQHHQFGVELIGSPSPEADAEVIELLFRYYERLGIPLIELHLNSVGDLPSRHSFRSALLDILTPVHHLLSPDSQSRLEKNPLRILDSKAEEDQPFLDKIPPILNFLSPASKDHFQKVQELLQELAIPFHINPRIVRGLDYYQHTVFEMVVQDTFGNKSIGGGGRYDGLVKTFQGPDLPAVGFGTGLERIAQVILNQSSKKIPESQIDAYFIPLGKQAQHRALILASKCRTHQLSADVHFNVNKINQALTHGETKRARYFVFLGDEELSKQTLQIRHALSKDRREIQESELISLLTTPA
jgi:histidyl-tRNA synthetase